MTVLLGARACLTAVLMITGAAHMPAQSPPPSAPQSPPAQSPVPSSPAQPHAQAEPAKPQAEQAPRRTRRQGRTKKPARQSPRRPSDTREPIEPARISRDSGPTRQELTVSANVTGGYDDNVVAGSGTGQGIVPTAMTSGSTGYADAALRYFRGDGSRSIHMESAGNLRAYPDYFERPAAGGVATVGATTTARRGLTLSASERVAAEPFFNVLSTGASSAPLSPEIGQTATAAGLFERRSLTTATSVSIDRLWTQKDSTALSYSYNLRRFRNDDRGDNRSHDVAAEYRRTLARGLRSRAAYRYTSREYTDHEGTARFTREHTIEYGTDIGKVLSRRRHLVLSLTAGASHIESIRTTSGEPYRFWMPVGSGSAIFGLSRLWSVEGGYRRDFSRLWGITDEVYGTDSAHLTIGGLVAARTELRMGATYSNWRTPFVSGVHDRFDVYGASLQLQFVVTATLAATARYVYYQHRYSNPADLPFGFPARYDRHAFTVGLSLRVPLMGTGHQQSGVAGPAER